MGQDKGQGIKLFFLMDRDIGQLFNEFWDNYKPDEIRFPRRRAATFRAWCNRTPIARKAMLDAIMPEGGGPKWKNPYFYVTDFPEPQPQFLRGNEKGDLVQVRYNGLYKICTRETAEEFGLTIVRDWN